MKKNIGFVICSRTDSKRIPNKPLQLVNGMPLIEHLVKRLKPTGIMICLAVPGDQVHSYAPLIEKYGVKIVTGYKDDPLARMRKAAKVLDLDAVIRVTHDKVFLDYDTLYVAIDRFWRRNLDYIYSTEFCDGSAFEIMSTKVIDEAADKFVGVEHISYAIKSIAKQKERFWVYEEAKSDARFLVDYPEDLTLLECVMANMTNECDLRTAIAYVEGDAWLKKLNKLPELTIYTCVYNGQEFLSQCMSSVINQEGFSDYEYIVIDDHSEDKSFEIACKYASKYPNIRLYRNQKNKGLSSSSNFALSKAKGKYIMRLDADDFFFRMNSCKTMLKEIKKTKKDVIYPGNWHGSFDKVQPPDECHHIGGAMFSTKALNHVKFTDRLRNHDSLDIFLRAKNQIDIGYLAQPMFFYRQHGISMSKTNLELRAQTKKDLISRYGQSARP